MASDGVSTEKVLRLVIGEFFHGLSREELGPVAPLLTEVTYAPGTSVFGPEDGVGHLWILEEGKVKLWRASEQGKEVILAVLTPGSVFGEFSVTETRRPTTSAEALEEVRAYRLGREDFEEMTRRCPPLGLRTVDALLQRMNWAEQQIEDLVFRSVASRVAHLFLRLSEVHGRVGPRGVTLDLRLTHQEIGNMVGATRETVTNVLSDLRARGLVDIRRKRAVILDPDQLGVVAKG